MHKHIVVHVAINVKNHGVFLFPVVKCGFSGRFPVGLIIIHTYLIRLQNSGFSYVTRYNFVLSALK